MHSHRTRTIRYVVGAALLYTALTAVMTYPQVLHLTDTVHDDGDPLLNAWALSWVAHQLPRAPAHIFDANIFYPERRTLAYSETMLVPAAIAAPLQWMGLGSLLVYNIVFLSGFIVSGAGVALLVRSLTGSGAAGILSGLVFAFLPYRIDHYPHLQLQQTQFLPFAFWAFHRLVRTGRVKDGVLFGALTAAQVHSCMYYGLFLVPFMAVICGTLLIAARAWTGRHLAAVAAAALVAGVALLPVGRAYMDARKVVGERSAEQVRNGSARARNYLGPPEENLLFGTALKPFADGERRLFPGFTIIALAAMAVWGIASSGREGLRSPAFAYALGLVIAFDMSLGFNGLTYGPLYEYVLPFRGLRIPARMGIMVGFSLAVLGGYAVARVARQRTGVAVVLALLMLAEYASKPLDLRKIPTTMPEAYADIVKDSAGLPTPVVFEFPATPFDDPTYMYFSTFHWLNLVNGYSGFFPPAYGRLLEAVKDFPEGAAFDAIKSHGTQYLVVHGERLYGARFEQLVPVLEARPDLKLVSRHPAVGPDGNKEMRVYRIALALAQ